MPYFHATSRGVTWEDAARIVSRRGHCGAAGGHVARRAGACRVNCPTGCTGVEAARLGRSVGARVDWRRRAPQNGRFPQLSWPRRERGEGLTQAQGAPVTVSRTWWPGRQRPAARSSPGAGAAGLDRASSPRRRSRARRTCRARCRTSRACTRRRDPEILGLDPPERRPAALIAQPAAPRDRLDGTR